MPKLYTSVNGQATEINNIYCSVDGKATPVQRIYGSRGGEAVVVWERGYVPSTDYGIVYTGSGGSTPSNQVIIPSKEEFNKLCGTGAYRTISINGVTVNNGSFAPQIMGVEIGRKITEIPDNFLRDLYGVNQPIIFPKNVKKIGSYCLAACQGIASNNGTITISSGITEIGSSFLYNASSTNTSGRLTVQVDAPASVLDGSSLSTQLSTQYSGYQMYVRGITLTGTYAADWKSKLPDRTSNPFRKLLLG